MAPRVRTLITEDAGAADVAVLRSRRAARHYLASITTGAAATALPG